MCIHSSQRNCAYWIRVVYIISYSFFFSLYLVVFVFVLFCRYFLITCSAVLFQINWMHSYFTTFLPFSTCLPLKSIDKPPVMSTTNSRKQWRSKKKNNNNTEPQCSSTYNFSIVTKPSSLPTNAHYRKKHFLFKYVLTWYFAYVNRFIHA